MNLNEFLAREADALEREFRDATAPDRTPRSIRRVRAVRHGATAGVSVVAMGALVVGGVRLAGWEQPEPGVSIGPSPNALQAALIDPSADPKFSPWATVPACGAPAPDLPSELAGMRLHLRTASEVTVTASRRVDGIDARATVTNVAAQGAIASVSSLEQVWTQDGVVVAYSASPFTRRASGESVTGSTTAGESINVASRFQSETYRCDSPVNGPWTTLGPGDYDVYLVVRVVGTVDGAEAAVQRAPLDVTLATGPVTVTLTSSWQQTMAELDARERGNWPEVPQCGASVPAQINFNEEFWMWANPVNESTEGHRLPQIGDPMAVWADSSRLLSPTILTLPREVDVWYLAYEGYSDDGSPIGRVIAGHVVIDVGQQNEVTLASMNDGFETTGRVVSSQWCDGRFDDSIGSVVDVTVTWTDVVGSREVRNVRQ